MDTIFVIGIGGTGTGIVSKLKQKINKIYPDPAFNPLGRYYYSFVIDTEPYEHQNLGIDRIEYFPATNFDGDDRVENWSDATKGIKEFNNWWPGPKVIGYFKKGAGAYRSKGKLALLYHVKEVEPSILDGINTGVINAKKVLASSAHGATVRVFIACSLCGGTGSGMFIDLAYLIKRELKRNDFNPIIVGVFFLPGAMRGITNDETYLKWFGANTYASLLELNFWQNPEKKDGYKFYYSEKTEISVDAKFIPFDYAIFIEGKNKKDRFLENFSEYEQLAADIIYDLGLRESTSGKAERVMDNIQSHFLDESLDSLGMPRMFGSFGRGILRYPYRKFKRYLALKLFQEILREKILKEPESQEITKDIEDDLKDSLKLWEDLPGRGNRDDLIQFMKNPWTDEIGLEHYFPSLPPISSRLEKLTKKNYNRVLNELEESLVGNEGTIRNHSEKKKYEKIKVAKNDLKNILGEHTKRNGIGYLHQYLNKLLNKISGKIMFYKEAEKSKTTRLSQISDDRLNALRNLRISYSKKFGGKKEKWLQNYERNFVEYYNLLAERIGLEFKISFWNEFKNILESYKSALDQLHNTLKKPVLQEIENSLESILLGYEDIYERSQLVIEVLKNNTDFLNEMYNQAKKEVNFVNNNNTILHVNLFVSILLGQIDKEGLFEKYLSGDMLKEYEKEQLRSELMRTGVELLEKSFEKILDISVWEALEREAKYNGHTDPNEILSYIKEKASLLQDEVAQPFWKTADVEESFPQRLLVGDSESLKKFQKRYSQLTIESLFKEAEFIEFGANKSEIVLCYGELGIPIYKQPLVEGKYKDEFNELKNRKILWIDKRLNENILPTLTPTSLETSTLFLLSEHFKIVIPTIDKKGKETGFYSYRSRTLAKGLKGRDKAIKWFQSPSSTRTAVLNELQKKWEKINPSDRKQCFEELATFLEKKSSDRKISEYLKDIYKENWETIKDAIEKKIYDREELVTKRFLEE
jgi:hypothetical protein